MHLTYCMLVFCIGIFATSVSSDCSEKVKADGNRVDDLLDIIQEQREARKCVERKLQNKVREGICYKFMLTGEYVTNTSISASSTHDHCTNKLNYFLNAKQLQSSGGAGGWCVGNVTTNNFVQISFARAHNIRGIATQGRYGSGQWVTKYKVYFSTDCLNFHTDEREYAGNFDPDAIVVHLFDEQVVAKCIRINPMEFHSHMSMRFDVIGC